MHEGLHQTGCLAPIPPPPPYAFGSARGVEGVPITREETQKCAKVGFLCRWGRAAEHGAKAARAFRYVSDSEGGEPARDLRRAAAKRAGVEGECEPLADSGDLLGSFLPLWIRAVLPLTERTRAGCRSSEKCLFIIRTTLHGLVSF